MIRAIIVEDEQLAAQRLKGLITASDPGVEVVAILESVRETVKHLSLHTPDLIFMDIHLGDGNAFEIFHKVKVQSPVIFTTAYDRYAIRAFKVNSIDYLLKPVNPEELGAALDKYRNQIRAIHSGELGNLLRSLQEQRSYKQRFMVYAGRKILSVTPDKIACFYILEKGYYLLTHSGNTYAIDYSLDQLEEVVDPSCFFRVNRKLLLRVDAIKAVESLSKSRLKVITQHNLPVDTLVSVHRTAAFRLWLDK